MPGYLSRNLRCSYLTSEYRDDEASRQVELRQFRQRKRRLPHRGSTTVVDIGSFVHGDVEGPLDERMWPATGSVVGLLVYDLNERALRGYAGASGTGFIYRLATWDAGGR